MDLSSHGVRAQHDLSRHADRVQGDSYTRPTRTSSSIRGQPIPAVRTSRPEDYQVGAMPVSAKVASCFGWRHCRRPDRRSGKSSFIAETKLKIHNAGFSTIKHDISLSTAVETKIPSCRIRKHRRRDQRRRQEIQRGVGCTDQGKHPVFEDDDHEGDLRFSGDRRSRHAGRDPVARRGQDIRAASLAIMRFDPDERRRLGNVYDHDRILRNHQGTAPMRRLALLAGALSILAALLYGLSLRPSGRCPLHRNDASDPKPPDRSRRRVCRLSCNAAQTKRCSSRTN
ncbi:MAG: hypothetical protein MZU97_01330 [Bacillus subtilis]|nr:hypothetical protein [Bacillus subtilis]